MSVNKSKHALINSLVIAIAAVALTIIIGAFIYVMSNMGHDKKDNVGEHYQELLEECIKDFKRYECEIKLNPIKSKS